MGINMGNYPSMGTKGGTVIGALEINNCCICPGTRHGGCCTCCCPGLASPSGLEWDSAKPGFEPMLKEAAHIAHNQAAKGCCGCHDVFNQKSKLDAEWTPKANEFLGQHGLSVEVCAFVTSDGKNAHPHLVLQFTKTHGGETPAQSGDKGTSAVLE